MKTKKIPFVSILVTVYNREKYLADCLESILRSTYTDFELIVLDDASTDDSYLIAKSYSEKDERIKLYKNDTNLGQFKNRNKIVDLASAEYIKFLDSDDIIYKHSLDIMIDAIKQFPEAGLGIPHTDYITKHPYPFLLGSEQALKEHYDGKNFLAYGPSASIFKKKEFLDVGGFDLNFGILADTHLTLKLAAVAPVAFIPRDLIYWRIHGEQVTEGQKRIVDMITLRYKITMNILNNIACPLSQKQKKRFISQYSKIRTRHFINLCLKGKLKGAFKIRQETDLSIADLIASAWPNRFNRQFNKTR
jgi:glycosyltransferase involved in cell wall biosynthesis